MKYYSFLFIWLFFACSVSIPEAKQAHEMPQLYPDYAGVTIPFNVAPLNFRLDDSSKEGVAVLSSGDKTLQVKAKKGTFSWPQSRWKNFLKEAKGETLQLTLYIKDKEWKQYNPIEIRVAEEPVDGYLAYRLIEPGYELWNRMGIYQRNLENYTQSVIVENHMTENNCMNCHSFCMQDPEQMLFHMRQALPSTMLFKDGKMEKLNTKTAETGSFLVYPSWHPSGRYVAFSVNETRQGFHVNHSNRVEVYDLMSDVVVYDTEKHEIVSSSLLKSPDAFETFPTFSPDGRTLYFCSADARSMPQEFEDIHYSLCAVSFDPDKRSFGNKVDTLYNAHRPGKSVSFPRVSPDGRFLMYTLSDYGNFSIWHNEADLYMIDLSSGEHLSMDLWNSDDVESYHSWSSNSRWVVFSSRRLDGLYTRPFIGYIGEDGSLGKPFLLPQKDTYYYDRFMKSYNIPEFITGKVKVNAREIALKAKKEDGIDLRFVP